MGMRAWAWAGLTLLGLAAAFLASFVMATLPGRFGVQPTVRWDLAAWLILFGVLGAVAVVASARLALGSWPRVGASDIAILAVGLGIAAAEELALHEWAEGTAGYYDWDFIGPTAGLSLAVVALAIALFGTRVAPAGATGPPRLATAIAGVGVIAIVLSNVPDLVDGIGRGGAVAALIGLAGIYAGGAVLRALATRG